MGPTHKQKHNEGDRINDSYTLIKNYKRIRPYGNEWMWECKCDCGETFICRDVEYVLMRKLGCKHCTQSKIQSSKSKSEYGISHRGLIRRLYREYKRGAEKRNLPFELTEEIFLELILGNCIYCGAEPDLHDGYSRYMQKTEEPLKFNGIDRVDTKRGYVEGNVVSCCSKCNYAKHDMTLSDFKEWIMKVYHNLLEVN